MGTISNPGSWARCIIKSIYPLLGLVPSALSADVYQTRSVSGWEVGPMADNDGSCYATQIYEGAGSTELFLVLNPQDGVYILIGNDNWSIKKGEAMDLDYGFSIGTYKNVQAIGTSDRRFLSNFSIEFLDTFSRSTELNISRNETLIDSLNLKGSGAAVVELRRCVASIKREVEKLNKERKRLDHIQLDPFSRSKD